MPLQRDELDSLASGLLASAWSRKMEALGAIAAKLATGEVSEHDESILVEHIVVAVNDSKWEVQKAAAIALAEARHADPAVIQKVLEELASEHQNRFVKEAAARALRRFRSRTQRAKTWNLTEETRDPTLQYIVKRIREIGLRSMTPAHIYELAMELSDQSYREVAADTAHEMRNLVTPFEGYLVELRRHLASDGREDETSERYISLALSRLSLIERLIENLGIYSEPTHDDFVPIELATVVNEAIEIGADRGEQIADGGAIARVIDLPHALTIEALPDRLVRALANLIANACQAMEAGGTLAVRGRITSTELVELEIVDTGTGMTPEDVEQARLRFRSTRRDDGGTGLGLPIAERVIVNDHHGELVIDSTLGKGTTITITLPLKQRTGRDP